MSGPSDTLLVRTMFARDAGEGDYALSLIAVETGDLLASIRLPAKVVEDAVLGHLALSLELRPDGTVAAFLDRGDCADLTSKSLAELATEALSVLSVEDDLDDLAKLENMLETLLTAVRHERQRLGARSGN